MKKRQFFILSSLLLSTISMVSCGGGGTTIDTTKTQIYVNNYYGGFGSEWLTKVAARFEQQHANDSFEENKKGVQVVINNEKSNISEKSSTILTGKDEVYFNEWAYFYTLKAQNIVGDITAAVTSVNPYDQKTIASKLTDAQKDYFNIKDGGNDHYYALPHYTGLTGIVYNKELFDEKKYYLIDEPTGTELEDYFIYNDTDKKSPGVDGIYGNEDDGLPSTYDEFYKLCEYVSVSGDTPLNWTGAYKDLYLQCFLNALVADAEGLDEMMKNYTLSGTTSNLGRIVDGVFVKDTLPTTISDEEGYEVVRDEGRYHALTFLSEILTTSKWQGKMAMNSGYSHIDAQTDFIYAGHDGGATKPMAMLIEGNWWESEATTIFDKMSAQMGSQYKKENRQFGWMPLPKPNQEYLTAARARGVNQVSTLDDYIFGVCFMKSNVSEWKKPLIYDFIQFVNSDQSLSEYTVTTNTTKAFNYELSNEDYQKLTYFGKSLVNSKKNSQMVYPYSSKPSYINNQQSFGPYNYYRSTVGSVSYQYVTAPLANGITPEAYFSGMYTYYSNNWFVK